MSAVIFGDELQGSPASDLYSTMSELVKDRGVPGVGGFASVVSNRGPGFRFSVYSDMLFDWPDGQPETYDIDLNRKIALSSTDENVNYSITQIPPLHMDANYVAFYLLRGKIMFLFYGTQNGLANKCQVITDLKPSDIYGKITEILGIDLEWLVLVMSSYSFNKKLYPQAEISDPDSGMMVSMFCHANTCPKDNSKSGLLRVGPVP